MIVYIEDVLIENFFVTMMLLLILGKVFLFKQKKLKLFFVSLFASIVAVCYPLINFNGLLLIAFKLCLGYIIVFLYAGKNNLQAKFITYIFLTALFAGINILVYYFAYGTINIKDNFATYILLIIIYFCYYMINSCIKLFKKNFAINNFVYTIKINHQEKEILSNAFLDSGNTLLEDGEPVFIINFKLFKKIYSDITLEDIVLKKFNCLKNPHYIKSGFASGSGKILVFEVDSFTILADKNLVFKNAKLGVVYSNFNKNFNCNVLLNINAFAHGK